MKGLLYLANQHNSVSLSNTKCRTKLEKRKKSKIIVAFWKTPKFERKEEK